jgi:hypothetical protein
VLLHGGRRESSLQFLDERGHVEGLHGHPLADAATFAPFGEAAHGRAFRYALRVWSLLICAVKHSRTRFAALGVGVKSDAWNTGGAGMISLELVIVG